MKSTIYSPYLDTFGGGERYMLTIAELLQEKGNVTIFWNDASIKSKLEERFALDLSDVTFARNIFNSPLPKKIAVLRSYDLLVYLSDGSFPAGLAKNNILHMQVPFQLKHGRSLKNRLKLKTWHQVVVNSQYTKSVIDQTFGVDSLVVYPPVNVDKFAPVDKQQFILSVGRYYGANHGKKQEVLIEAFKRMIGEGLHGWRLVFVGSVENADYFNELKARTTGFPIELYGDVPFDALKEWYAKSAIYWHAAGFQEDNPQYAEHFGITTVEAMASGCVPIVIDKGGQKEIITAGQTGFLWSSIDELIRQTEVVIVSEKLQKQIAQKAREKSLDFSKQKFIENFERML